MKAETTMECIQCGATVVSGQSVCEACGASLCQGAAVVPPEEIAGLLAEATLLRAWGQYEEAINVCIRIVRLDARNFPAHSLLGDLCRDQSNYRDALSWYKLAVQLEPGNEIVRRKLDEMIDHVFQGATRNGESTPVLINTGEQGPSAAPTPSRQTPRLRQLLTKVQPAHLVLGCTVLAIAFMLLFMLNTSEHSIAPVRNPSAHLTPTAEPLNPAAGNGQQTPKVEPPTAVPPPADAVENGGTANSSGTAIPGLPGIELVRPKADDQNHDLANTGHATIRAAGCRHAAVHFQS